MKRIFSVLIILCMVFGCVAVLGGCSDDKGKDFPVTVGDVTIDEEPQCIVVLNDNFADIISYIGYDVKMVGRSIECDQDFLRVVPSVGTAETPAVDTIVNRGADLVIADGRLSEKSRKKIEKAGITIVTLEDVTDTDALKKLYITLGTILGGNVTGAEKGENAYNALFTMLKEFKTTTGDIVKTAVYLYLDEEGQLCTFTTGSIEQKVFNYNGAMNCFSNQSDPVVNEQELRLANPTYIFYDAELNPQGQPEDEKVLEYLSSHEDLMHLTAVKEGRVCCIPKENFSRMGTSCEKTVYRMIDYIKEQEEATPDEAETEAPTEAPTQAPTAAPTKAQKKKATEPVVEDTDDDGGYYEDDGYYDEEYYEDYE